MIFESQIMKNAGWEIRGKFPAIRFWHLITGLGDFGERGGRYQQVLRSIRKQHRIGQSVISLSVSK